MAAICYTSKEAPLFFIDRFHKVREMINAFNKQYSSEYKPSWLNCIDALMSSQLNKFCPGLLSLPCKPHLFGNKYYSIANGDSGKLTMWQIRIVEG
jgi:hypothetical protein